jgi:hypothetical protein
LKPISIPLWQTFIWCGLEPLFTNYFLLLNKNCAVLYLRQILIRKPNPLPNDLLFSNGFLHFSLSL